MKSLKKKKYGIPLWGWIVGVIFLFKMMK